MHRLSRLAAIVPLLVLSGAAAAAPVSATFSGVMAASAFDPLGAFGPAGADLGGAIMRTTISFDATLPYTATGSADQYTQAAPGGGAITISITIGGVTLTKTSSYAGLLEAISIGIDTEAIGYAADAQGDMLGYGIASAAQWTAGTMDTSAAFGALLTQTDAAQVQYLQFGTAPEDYEYLVFTGAPTIILADQQIIAEPTTSGLLAVALLALGVARRRRPPAAHRPTSDYRPLSDCRPTRQLC